MAKRLDIRSVLVIGAGPIVIGQACEFDYSGTQACKALKEEGYRIILLNSNPATIMTDPAFADVTYVEPVVLETLQDIIEREKPDAILPTVGGQTALNLAVELEEAGILQKFGIELIGTDVSAIKRAEDRQLFKQVVSKIGAASPRSMIIHDMDQAELVLDHVGLPAIIRPSFTLGGEGGGVAYNLQEFEQIVTHGLKISPTHEVQIDQSVMGWKEYEMEVMRDSNDNCIIVCAIENIDPMGVHTGDSMAVAPALTLTDKEYQRMRNIAITLIREIGIKAGGANVQFAVNPENGELLVIEANPRVSRSSALASKATGFPIAKISAKLAAGYSLDEVLNDSAESITAALEPVLDYVVTKIPRFNFDKFPDTAPELSSSMKSVGEVMAIGRSFAESLQKALCSLENGLNGFNELSRNEQYIRAQLAKATPERILLVADAFRVDISLDEVQDITRYDRWFLEQIRGIVEMERKIAASGLPDNSHDFLRIKKMGFSDERIAKLTGSDLADVAKLRNELEVQPVYKRVDTCAAEFLAKTSYMYSCYEDDFFAECESDISAAKKVAILGSGPNRIGQGIEFDYVCVCACYALRELGYETIMINCNPATVSTDYDTSDRLYFEPLTAEHVIEILRKEQQKGQLLGVIIQFGGQTPLKLAKFLLDSGINILGTHPDSVDLAEDREKFKNLLQALKLKQPPSDICYSWDELGQKASKIDLPALIRPSYVLGGGAMQIFYDDEALRSYASKQPLCSGAILIDKFLTNAIEVDVDALCDGNDVFIAGIMEHIEEAGIHSGDSSCSLPAYSLSQGIISEIKQQTRMLALALKIKGLLNIQYAVRDKEVYILEVNPRASRTIPFVAKATGIPIAQVATCLILGQSLSSFDLAHKMQNYIAVKEPVFPFARFFGTDVLLGPEMKSTGEVMGISASLGCAFAKAKIAAGVTLPVSGTVFVSVNNDDKHHIVGMARELLGLGFKIVATSGTASYLQNRSLPVRKINKVREGRPHIVDILINGDINLVINTTKGAKSIADSFSIRRTALSYKVPYSTTIRGANAAIMAIKYMKNFKKKEILSLQECVKQLNSFKI